MYSSFVLCTHTTICSHLLVHQNPESLLEGLDFDRDRTRVSNRTVDWTLATTQGYYILLSDIFRPGAIPANYGNAMQVVLDAAALQQIVLDEWV